MEVGTSKNHNNKLKTKREKTTNKRQEKKKTNDKKTYLIKKCYGISPRKAPNFNLQNEKVEKQGNLAYLRTWPITKHLYQLEEPSMGKHKDLVHYSKSDM